jgi:hypothetical protein
VSANEFSFSTEVSGPGQPPGLMRAMIVHALGFTGGPEAVAAALVELDQAIARAAVDGRRSRLEVQSVGGRMEIALSSDDGLIWRSSRPLA